MTLPRTTADVLSGHVLFEIESIDRMYLNVYQPKLQYGGGVSAFFVGHRGHKYASSVLMAPITEAFVANIHHFINARGLDLVARGRADRDGSRVHCDSLDEGGAQLCPCGIATPTPQHFTVASRQTSTCPPGSSPFRNEGNGCAPLPAPIHQI